MCERGSLDIHTHLAPVLHDGSKVGGPPALSQPTQLLAFLDECRIERALVSAPPPFFRQEQEESASRSWVRKINDGLLEAVAEHDRLLPLLHLPVEHPGLAVAELERAAASAPWAGFSIPAGGRSAAFDDERLDPVWRAIEGLGKPVVLHPGAARDPRLEKYYLANLLGNPLETTVSVAELIFGGVLEKYPGLRIALVHCGGVLPSVLGRWQRGFDTERPGVNVAAARPMDLAQKLYVDTIAHDPQHIDHVLSLLGPQRLLFGSDWPFAMGSRPREEVAHLSEDQIKAVAVDNAARFLGGEDHVHS